MSYGYRILPEHGIIIQLLEKKLNLKDMELFMSLVRQDKLYKPAFNSLIDVRNSYMDISEEDMHEYMKHLERTKNAIHERKFALLISKPEHFVHVKLMSELAHGLPFKIKIFTTFDTAAIWLNSIELNEKIFEDTINIIRENPLIREG